MILSFNHSLVGNLIAMELMIVPAKSYYLIKLIYASIQITAARLEVEKVALIPHLLDFHRVTDFEILQELYVYSIDTFALLDQIFQFERDPLQLRYFFRAL
jgi:hypothetical protein